MAGRQVLLVELAGIIDDAAASQVCPNNRDGQRAQSRERITQSSLSVRAGPRLSHSTSKFMAEEMMTSVHISGAAFSISRLWSTACRGR